MCPVPNPLPYRKNLNLFPTCPKRSTSHKSNESEELTTYIEHHASEYITLKCQVSVNVWVIITCFFSDASRNRNRCVHQCIFISHPARPRLRHLALPPVSSTCPCHLSVPPVGATCQACHFRVTSRVIQTRSLIAIRVSEAMF